MHTPYEKLTEQEKLSDYKVSKDIESALTLTKRTVWLAALGAVPEQTAKEALGWEEDDFEAAIETSNDGAALADFRARRSVRSAIITAALANSVDLTKEVKRVKYDARY